MEYRTSNRTGLKTSAIGLSLGGLERHEKNLIITTLTTAAEEGTNFLLIPALAVKSVVGACVGDWLQVQKRANYVLGIAIGSSHEWTGGGAGAGRAYPPTTFTPTEVEANLVQTMARLQVDYLDVLLLPPLHLEDLSNPLLCEKIRLWKEAGVVKTVAATFNSLFDVLAAIRSEHTVPLLDYISIRHNFYNSQLTSKALSELNNLGLAVFVQDPLAGGSLLGSTAHLQSVEQSFLNQLLWKGQVVTTELLGDYFSPKGVTMTQAALRYCLDIVGVTSVLVDVATVGSSRLQEVYKTLRLPPLTHSELVDVRHLIDPDYARGEKGAN